MSIRKHILTWLLLLSGLAAGAAGYPPDAAYMIQLNYRSAAKSAGDTTWSAPGYRLSSRDFKGPSDYSGKAEAEFVGFLSLDMQITESEQGGYGVMANVKSYMLRSQSWSRVALQDHQELLWHEQQHYNILTLFGKSLHAGLQDLAAEKLPLNDFLRRAEQLYDQTLDQYNTWQQDYDHETEHGKNEQAQKAWDFRISYAMKEAFRSPASDVEVFVVK